MRGAGIGKVLYVAAAAMFFAAAAHSEVVLDGGSQSPSQTQASYAFRCGDQPYKVVVEMHGWAKVQLGRFDFPGHPLSAGDRLKIQSALDRFGVVHEVGLRCHDTGGDTDFVTISGLSRGEENVAASSNHLVMILHIKRGRLVDIAY